MHFCRYYVFSDDLNFEDFSKIWIFKVSFGQNMGIWPPGVPMNRVCLNRYAIDFKNRAWRFILKVFLRLLCVIYWFKLWGLWHNINIRGHFWSKFGYLTPGEPICRVPATCYPINVEDIASRFILNAFLGLPCVMYWPKVRAF